MNITELSDEELNVLRLEVLIEQERRQTLANAPAKADELARRYLTATGVEDGDPWTQPTGAHDAHPAGWTVTHNGKTWISLIPANVWEPGISGWREVTEDEMGPAEWVEPSGAHDAYNTGDRVSFQGEVWESVLDGNIWSPTDHPTGWILVADDDGEESSPDPENGEVTVPDFVQPTGGHDAYNTGDQVMFEGAVWESVVDGNVWSPTDNPTGWEQID